MSMPESILREKAISLLGDLHMGTGEVAAILGVTPGRISQFLSEPAFSEAVANKKIATLQEATKRDQAYDALEDTLLIKLKQSLAMTIGHKPKELASILNIVNNAKRRGAGPGEVQKNNTNLATITLPSNIALQFTMNVHNQVIQVTDGTQDTTLVTLQTQKIKDLVAAKTAAFLKETKEISHDNKVQASNIKETEGTKVVAGEGLGKLKSFFTSKGFRRPVHNDLSDL